MKYLLGLWMLSLLTACGSPDIQEEAEVEEAVASQVRLVSWNGQLLATFSESGDSDFFAKLYEALEPLSGTVDAAKPELYLEFEFETLGLWLGHHFAQVMKESQPGRLWDIPSEFHEELRALVQHREKETIFLEPDVFVPHQITDILPWTDAIIEGIVTGQWVQEHGDALETITELEIAASWKGILEPGNTIFVRQLGGETEQLKVKSDHWVPFGRQERWLLFLMLDSQVSATFANPYGAFRYDERGISWRSDWNGNVLTEAAVGLLLQNLDPSLEHIRLQAGEVDAFRGEFILANDSHLNYRYGAAYWLERKVGGYWETLAPRVRFQERETTLEAMGSHALTFDWELVFGGLEAGAYRLTKQFFHGRMEWEREFLVTVEFDIQ